jgi:hypothetical protein
MNVIHQTHTGIPSLGTMKAAISIVVLGGASILALVLVVSSLQWQYVHDLPTLLYVGWMIDHGAVIYRDIFDVNMPGTYFLMWAIGRVTDWSDIGIRLVDISAICMLSTLTFLWMRPFGRYAQWCAVVLFPIHYLGTGHFSFIMEREVLILMPLVATMVLASGAGGMNERVRGLAIGLLVGLGALIKPQFTLLFLPAVGQYLWDLRTDGRALRRQLAFVAAGALGPIAITVAYMAINGSFGAFWEMTTGLLPLYNQMTGAHKILAEGVRTRYILENSLSGINIALFTTALLGIAFDGSESAVKARVLLFTILIAAGSPALAGKFWDYHYLPFVFFAFCGTALCFSPACQGVPRLASAAALLAAVYIVVGLCVPVAFAMPDLEPIRSGQSRLRVSTAVASYLKEHSKPGDKAQPLDWTDGVLHGMLKARIPLATRFMADFQFYYNVNSDYVKRLRGEFMGELRQSKPRWIIATATAYKGWPGGASDGERFPELERFVQSNYAVVTGGENFLIFELDATKAGDSPIRAH